jgi:penicillin-binding protein 1B
LRFRLQKGFWTSAFGLGLLALAALCVLIFASVFTFYYVKYSRMINARLSGHILQNTTQIFSAPEPISTGQAWGVEDLVSYLQRAGYRPEEDDNSLGEYTVQGSVVDIRPSKLSYFAGGNDLAVQFNGRTIKSIRPLSGGPDMGTGEIEPELITNLFDSAREKRRPVHYADLPPTLVQAILSAEDKRFFEHPGFDFIRIFGAAWADIRHGQHVQGASTITMQVARTYYLEAKAGRSYALLRT